MPKRSELALCVLLACTAGDDQATDTDTVLRADPSGAVPLTDAQNYTYSGLIDAPSYPTAPSTEVVLDFAAVDEDMRCHDLDPVAEIDNLALMAFPYLSEEEVEAGLADDSLEQVDLGGYVAWENLEGATSTSIDTFTFFGTDPDLEEHYLPEEATWLLLLTTGTQVGVGSRALAFLEPTEGSEVMEVDLGTACGILDFEAELEALEEVPILSAGPYVVDWSGLTVDGRGNEIDQSGLDAIMLAFYAEKTPGELEASFLDLELIPDLIWEAEVIGTELDLSSLEGFDGFSRTDGTWLLALRCSLCPNPAPLFLTVLQPE